jgi:glycosyltransferase involved in cell wall biosynthesis
MKATIIITSFNKEDFLKETIESALNQSYDNFEILIIDDGSTDNSRQTIEEFQHPRITTIFKENEGVIKTRNRAIQEAKGKYIVQLDGDDILGKDFLKKTIPEIENNPSVGLVYCSTKLFGAKNEIWELGEYSIEKQLTTNQIVITALFKKDDYLKTNGYNQNFSEGLEDWDFWLSLIELGIEVKQLNDVEFFYRILPDSRNNFTKGQERKIKNLIWENHKELYAKYITSPTNLLWEIHVLKSQIKDLNYYKNSRAFKIGDTLLNIPRKIKSLFSANNS